MDEISPARQTRAVEALVDPRDWTCQWYEDQGKLTVPEPEVCSA
jgi:hypothetical protein